MKNKKDAILSKKNIFKPYGAFEENPKWQLFIERKIKKEPSIIRSEFEKDFNKILHSKAYRRLKHKTQVFFAVENDHICTRIEHINIVSSVSYTIAKFFGLNTELTNAIAIGHDLGHAPFGHFGETVLKEIAKNYLNENFWHEKNGLRFVDSIETIVDEKDYEKNLNLTYAVRDGIISHCGEIDNISLKPREDKIDLEKIKKPSEYEAITWEGCIVKISDGISFIGRDIDDANTLGLVKSIDYLIKLKNKIKQIRKIIIEEKIIKINNAILMHLMVKDLMMNSNPNDGIKFSDEIKDLVKVIKGLNYDLIYNNKRLDNYKKYAKLIIDSIFYFLFECYKSEDTFKELIEKSKFFPKLTLDFSEWLEKYSNIKERNNRYHNKIIYHLENKNNYIHAVLDFISGMTDNYAERVFSELTSFNNYYFKTDYKIIGKNYLNSDAIRRPD